MIAAHRGGHDRGVDPRVGLHDRAVHVVGADDADRADALWVGEDDGARHERHVVARAGGGLGAGEAHLAARGIGDEADGVEVLARGPGGD
jgi:hypothetical protein